MIQNEEKRTQPNSLKLVYSENDLEKWSFTFDTSHLADKDFRDFCDSVKEGYKNYTGIHRSIKEIQTGSKTVLAPCSNKFIENNTQFQGVNLNGKWFPKNKSARIAIMGAGASGLATAHQLRKLGYLDITVLERKSFVGGKGWAIPDEHYEDLVHDMGTTSIGPNYEALCSMVRDASKLDNTVELVEPADTDGYRVFTCREDLKDYMEPGQFFMKGLKRWIFATVGHQELSKAFWFLPDMLMYSTIINHLRKYKLAVEAIFGPSQQYTLPPAPKTPEQIKALDITYGDFIKLNAPALLPLLTYGVHTYGHISRLPAYYGIYFFTPTLLSDWLDPLARNPPKRYLRRGWSHFWQTVVRLNELRVVVDFEVTGVVRDETKVTIKGNVQNKAWEEDFDFLFMASPPLTSETPWMDWRQEETEIFSKLVWIPMTITLVDVDPDPTLTEHVILMMDSIEDVTKYESGEVLAIRDSYRAVKTDLDDRNQRRRQMVAQVCSREQYSPELVKEKLEKYYSDHGVKDLKIIHSAPYHFFYQFKQPEINKGYPWKILDFHGKNRTAFVHASSAFESVNDTISYANMIVDYLYTSCSQ